MKFLRYPGGKGRLLSEISLHLPRTATIKGNYIEPFVGGGSIFFYQRPQRAILCDLNQELIELYNGIRLYPHKVWQTFESFPSGRESYYSVRDRDMKKMPLYFRAARTLYLNRTCFKGMWRHNPSGQFNVGYGGEDRRWVINHENLVKIANILRKAEVSCSHYEETISRASKRDFVFLDPPYKPGEKDLLEGHYSNGKFSFDDQKHLADELIRSSMKRKFRWLMTNSDHPEIRRLYEGFKIIRIKTGTGNMPGILAKNSSEILISNY